jgi:hypothetical protein
MTEPASRIRKLESARRRIIRTGGVAVLAGVTAMAFHLPVVGLPAMGAISAVSALALEEWQRPPGKRWLSLFLAVSLGFVWFVFSIGPIITGPPPGAVGSPYYSLHVLDFSLVGALLGQFVWFAARVIWTQLPPSQARLDLCAECGHDLAGVPSGECPECGNTTT